ncbi:PhzF family phenazine biosynthesis protein [Leucobacter sp. NPDC058333]|uniref:PhzF family phenazine biosynthesis protein n=1 Tax=Leucobacter sp. NPDC058333 TaxID=3346450 RepID=UPI003659B63E
MSRTEVTTVHVFSDGPNGGNPAPIVLDASGMTDDDMQRVAQRYGHECGFVFPAKPGDDIDFSLRFWVPTQEMSMCGHVTLGAVWLLQRGAATHGSRLRVGTASGVIDARVSFSGDVEIAQPAGSSAPVPPTAVPGILAALGLAPEDLADRPVRNASTSRVKTLVPVRSTAVLDAIAPNYALVAEACAAAESTGLYPYAVAEPLVFEARQFPRSSGYPEDAATGIAAAALVYGLIADGLVDGLNPGSRDTLHVRQGRAMGSPSLITVTLRDEGGVWLGGQVR